jgi:hypothetical protein
MDKQIEDDSDGENLAACEEALKEVKAENAQLRKSAEAFGQLAERLSLQLEERRAGTDRRADRRFTPDRRLSTGGLAAGEPQS